MSDKRIIDLEAKQTLGSGDYLAADSAQGTYKVDANTNIMTPLANVRNNVANSSASPDKYSTSTAYKVGDMVIQNDILYKCTTACSAASWAVNSACFTATTLASVVTQLNGDLIYKQKTLNISNGTGYVYFSRIAQIGFLEVRFTATNKLTSTPLEIGTLPDSLKPLHFIPLPIGIGDDHYGIDDIGTITINNDNGIIKIAYNGSKSGMKSAMGAVLFYIEE